MKDFLLHKITLRVAYITAAFLSTKSLVFLNDPSIQNKLRNIFVDPTIKPGALEWLKTSLGLGIMVAGEFVYNYWHTKVILPKVSKQVEGEKNEEITVIAKPVPTTVISKS